MLRWKQEATAKFMSAHGIRDRASLARRLPGIGETTVYRAFDGDWGGLVSIRMLAALSRVFDVPVSQLVAQLVADPRDDLKNDPAAVS